MTQRTERAGSDVRSRVIWIIAIVALSFVVRAGTAHFVGEHLDNAAWFQFGSYKVFDERAQGIIDGTEPVFFLNDPERTDLIQHPPAFPVVVALVYQIGGERTAHAVQRFQWPLDAAITPLLILAITMCAFGWRAAYVAGVVAALAPFLAFYGATPTADITTMWAVLLALLLLVLSVRKGSLALAAAAGVALGTACWLRVNPLFLVVPWVIAVILLSTLSLKKRAQISCSLAVCTILIIAPVILRNIAVYRQPVLTGLSVGVNLWEGLGETELGRENGFLYGDELMLQAERARLGRPGDGSIKPFFPDGITRDRERAREALSFIARHPVWYAGVMLTRMAWMLKVAGEPGPYYGTAGINCTPDKCLSDDLRKSGILAFGATIVGYLQSICRYLVMPLAALGIFFGFRCNKEIAMLPLATVLYYLIASSVGHTELRYVVPMHAVLIIFAGLGSIQAAAWLKTMALRDRHDHLVW